MVPQRGHGARCNGAPQALQNLDSVGLTCSQIGHSDRNMETCANPEGDFSTITQTLGGKSGLRIAAAHRRTAGRISPLLDQPRIRRTRLAVRGEIYAAGRIRTHGRLTCLETFAPVVPGRWLGWNRASRSAWGRVGLRRGRRELQPLVAPGWVGSASRGGGADRDPARQLHQARVHLASRFRVTPAVPVQLRLGAAVRRPGGRPARCSGPWPAPSARRSYRPVCRLGRGSRSLG